MVDFNRSFIAIHMSSNFSLRRNKNKSICFVWITTIFLQWVDAWATCPLLSVYARFVCSAFTFAIGHWSAITLSGHCTNQRSFWWIIISDNSSMLNSCSAGGTTIFWQIVHHYWYKLIFSYSSIWGIQLLTVYKLRIFV